MQHQDPRTVMSSGVAGLRPLATLFGLGVFAVVGAVIAFGAIKGKSFEAADEFWPLIERGELVACQVLSSTTSEPVKYAIEYKLDFEEEARSAVIISAPGVDDAGRYRVQPGGNPKRVPLYFDPLNPADVAFADTLEDQVDAALAHLQPWKRGAWIALFGGLLLSACTLLPMKRLASKHAVPLVHYYDDTYSPLLPAEFWKFASVIGMLGGLLTIGVSASIYLGNGSVGELASRGVTIRGEVVESFVYAIDGPVSHQFKLNYTLEEGGPRVETLATILGGERAQRFEVEEGQTREVALVVDPDSPRSVHFELPLQWELERARKVRTISLWTIAVCVVLTLASIWLFVRCRRMLIADPAPEPPRRHHRSGKRTSTRRKRG